jgi:DNA-binding transcriptional LysR family regulator
VQVEGFLEVARRGSVSRAAEALFITQPTLTARLQGLERELGTPLFLRTPHGMRLTDAGRAWIPFAERALRALVDGRGALEQVMTASAGHLMIAAAPAVSTYVLPELLEVFVASHPRVEVTIRTWSCGRFTPRTSSSSALRTTRSPSGVRFRWLTSPPKS